MESDSAEYGPPSPSSSSTGMHTTLGESLYSGSKMSLVSLSQFPTPPLKSSPREVSCAVDPPGCEAVTLAACEQAKTYKPSSQDSVFHPPTGSTGGTAKSFTDVVPSPESPTEIHTNPTKKRTVSSRSSTSNKSVKSGATPVTPPFSIEELLQTQGGESPLGRLNQRLRSISSGERPTIGDLEDLMPRQRALSAAQQQADAESLVPPPIENHPAFRKAQTYPGASIESMSPSGQVESKASQASQEVATPQVVRSRKAIASPGLSLFPSTTSQVARAASRNHESAKSFESLKMHADHKHKLTLDIPVPSPRLHMQQPTASSKVSAKREASESSSPDSEHVSKSTLSNSDHVSKSIDWGKAADSQGLKPSKRERHSEHEAIPEKAGNPIAEQLLNHKKLIGSAQDSSSRTSLDTQVRSADQRARVVGLRTTKSFSQGRGAGAQNDRVYTANTRGKIPSALKAA
jgi:hypothetical protein